MRVAIFIDGNNFYFGLKSLYGSHAKVMNFDFEEFCNYLANGRLVSRIFYYNAALSQRDEPEKFAVQQKFFSRMRKIPKLKIILGRLLRKRIGHRGRFFYTIKGDDVSLATDMVKGAFKNSFDTAVLVSGDGDFVHAVEIVKEQGKSVEEASFKHSTSLDLVNVCDKSTVLTKKILNKFFD